MDTLVLIALVWTAFSCVGFPLSVWLLKCARRDYEWAKRFNKEDARRRLGREQYVIAFERMIILFLFLLMGVTTLVFPLESEIRGFIVRIGILASQMLFVVKVIQEVISRWRV